MTSLTATHRLSFLPFVCYSCGTLNWTWLNMLFESLLAQTREIGPLFPESHRKHTHTETETVCQCYLLYLPQDYQIQSRLLFPVLELGNGEFQWKRREARMTHRYSPCGRGKRHPLFCGVVHHEKSRGFSTQQKTPV